MSKADRRARKKANRAKKSPRCDQCGEPVQGKDGNHDTPWSTNRICWDGLAVVAWCQYCGWDHCS